MTITVRDMVMLSLGIIVSGMLALVSNVVGIVLFGRTFLGSIQGNLITIVIGIVLLLFCVIVGRRLH